MDDLDLGATIRGFSAGQKVFNRYTLERILGRGGMGVVWLARDEELQRPVAMKFLPEVIMGDRASLEELKRETRRNLDLTHPHIVRIYDFVQDARTAAISMEYVAGDTLSNLRLDRPNRHFECDDLRDWVRQLGEALSYAHEKARIAHRDLKPANLMIDARGDLKVTDFGIARSLSDSVSRVSVQAGSSGTPVYMSPQQMMGEKPSASDDIYALGATLYELLTGKPPFYSGNIILQVQNKVPPMMQERRAELETEGKPIPESWETTIAACLAKEAKDRPQSVREVMERLEEGKPASVEPAEGRATSPRAPGLDSGAPGDENATRRLGDKPPYRKRILVSGVVVLLLAVASWWFGYYAPAQEHAAAMAAAAIRLDGIEQTVLAAIERRDWAAANAGLAGAATGEVPAAFGGEWRNRTMGLREEIDAGIAAEAEQQRIAEAEQRRIEEARAAEEARLARVRAEEQRVERERQAAMAAHPWREIEAHVRAGKSLWEAPLIAASEDVALLLEQVEMSKPALRGLSGRYGSKHPMMIEAVAEFEATAADLERTARNVADQHRIDFGLKFNGGSAPAWSQEPKTDAAAEWLETFRAEAEKLRKATPPVSATVPQPEPVKVAEPPANEPSAGQPWTVADLQLILMPIAPGTFAMGTASGGTGFERPVTRVTLSRPFWLGKTEVTQRQWQSVMGDNPGKHRGDTMPVGSVSWNMAMEFCRRLTQREVAAGRLAAGYVYTLPTEAQWEYACRAGTTGDFAGDLDAMGWHKPNSGGVPHEVGTKQANAWGLHDMHGNLWEWCLDWWGDYPGGAVSDPAGPSSGKLRVRRGGAWGSSAMGNAWLPGDNCRSANRIANEPDGRFDFVGFRIVLIQTNPMPAPSTGEVSQAGEIARMAVAAADRAVATAPQSRIIFFRPAKFGSILANLKVEAAEQGVLGDLKNGTWFECALPAGALKLSVTHSLMRDRAEVEFVLQAGRTYYLRCLPEGSSGMSTVPEVSLVGEIDGQAAVAKLKQLRP